jgi:hypothetical protein
MLPSKIFSTSRACNGSLLADSFKRLVTDFFLTYVSSNGESTFWQKVDLSTHQFTGTLNNS